MRPTWLVRAVGITGPSCGGCQHTITLWCLHSEVWRLRRHVAVHRCVPRWLCFRICSSYNNLYGKGCFDNVKYLAETNLFVVEKCSMGWCLVIRRVTSDQTMLAFVNKRIIDWALHFLLLLQPHYVADIHTVACLCYQVCRQTTLSIANGWITTAYRCIHSLECILLLVRHFWMALYNVQFKTSIGTFPN